MSKVKDKVKEALKEVDTEVVKENLGIVLDTVERINKTNTTSKADNIQRGVQDARKVLGVLSLLKAVLSVFKRKQHLIGMCVPRGSQNRSKSFLWSSRRQYVRHDWISMWITLRDCMVCMGEVLSVVGQMGVLSHF